MYLDHFSLTCRPFDLLPDPRFLYLGKSHDAALTSLHYGIETGAGFTVITGDIGAGKTTLLRAILNKLPANYTVGLITNTHRDFGTLLDWIMLAFGLKNKAKRDIDRYQRFTNFLIKEYASGKRVLVILDEAQNLDVSELEKLRVISNLNADHHRIIQIILSGQPEFRETLHKPELTQLAQRVTVDYHLGPLPKNEIGNYIHHRMKTAGCTDNVFSDDAVEVIAKNTNGVPRLMNILCNNALVYAYADQLKVIDRKTMNEVMKVTKDIGSLPFEQLR